MTATRPVVVRKRDGSREPFDVAKLRRSVAAAMNECRYDVRYAESLARAVEVHVAKVDEARQPTSDYIFRCVRTALAETGLTDVAEHVTAYRRERAARRRAVSVLSGEGPPWRTAPWRKSKVVERLEGGSGLTRITARILAGEIEYRVLNMNHNLVSSALIDEMIRIELLVWGLADAGCVTLTTQRSVHERVSDPQPKKEV
jgi:hypothetical protein